jgi:phosphoribosylglycinamide formyltransferase 2
LVTLVSQRLSEFALHARAILGLPVLTEMASPGASAVIYGGVEAGALVFDGVDEALKIPGSELRLFGKPQSFVKRRMGVALARGKTVEEARERAKRTAATVKPTVYLSH